MEGSDLYLDPAPSSPPPRFAGYGEGFWALGDTITWVCGLVLLLSPLMGWYAGTGVGVSLSVTGWHTGTLGKLVVFIGLAVVILVLSRSRGYELPGTFPESFLVLALGSLGTVFVLIRVINIPDAVLPAHHRGFGLWVALIASLGVIAGGLLRAAEDF